MKKYLTYILIGISFLLLAGLTVTTFLLVRKPNVEESETCDETEDDAPDSEECVEEETPDYTVPIGGLIGQSTFKFIDLNDRSYIFEFRLDTEESISGDGYGPPTAFSVVGDEFELVFDQGPVVAFDPSPNNVSEAIASASFGNTYRWSYEEATRDFWIYSNHLTKSGSCDLEGIPEGDQIVLDYENGEDIPSSVEAPCGWTWIQYPLAASEDINTLGLDVNCEASSSTGISRCDELIRTVVITPYSEPENY